MQIQTKAALITSSVFVILLLSLRVYPILADDKELLFTPIQQDDPTAYRELLQILRSEEKDLTLTPELEEKVESALEAPQLVDFLAALGIIKKLKENEAALPPAWEDSEFLSARLIEALKNDVHYLYQSAQEDSNLTRQIQLTNMNDSAFMNKADYLKLRILEIFTYQETKTFNTLWKRIEEFEANPSQGIQIEVDPGEFGFDNFFGKILLASVSPSLPRTVETINQIGSNQASGDNSE
ncbi:hypothetical protein [Coraliomargarita akajimensis]|uniref:Uncharacterized protein n=1 Tax=Coraliomargarita akajimensis (strain DSM 45221 / IAM 15411 / JCM 23193 / KCTC 12865 / 04OKA010-24) TaxID=583355 RepID=D5EI67_CORAD|nr:hypothetical protein [Coraliomargarita akajimensis]ADE56107.1 hypothetical protein Caka_3094 [Coraliomargarita akajimensis DSM 45221]